MPSNNKSSKPQQQDDQDWSSTTAYQTESSTKADSVAVLINIPRIYQKVKTEISRILNKKTSEITFYASVTNDSGVTVKRTQHIRRVRNNGKKHKMQILAAREWAREQDLRCRVRGSTGTRIVVGWYAVGQGDQGVEWIDGPDDRDHRVLERESRYRAARDREMKQRTEVARECERQRESRTRRGLDLERETESSSRRGLDLQRLPVMSRKGK
ncbi:hypothetical protein Slin14017_G066530 [Septoria linicola]|nr:hypothetical protein Slin14017_G066530 [Septoria linicola]